MSEREILAMTHPIQSSSETVYLFIKGDRSGMKQFEGGIKRLLPTV